MTHSEAKAIRWHLPMLHQRTGALTDLLSRQTSAMGLGTLPVGSLPDTVVKSVCGFCSTGCGLAIHIRDGAAINVTPDHGYPVNMGMACPKGWESLRVLDAPDRAKTPLLRQANGDMLPISWPQATKAFCERFKAIQAEHGAESVAFISTGQIATEEMFFLGCLAKFGMGLVHGDGNTRQCMATSAVAYKQAFGFDAPPFTYADLELSDVLVFVGANPCLAHPIIWQRVLRNRNNPALIVIDPRKTETAMAATEHLAIQPKSDLTLLYGIANSLIGSGAINPIFIENHTEGFEQFRTHVATFTLERVASETGISVAQLQRVVKQIADGKRVSFWWTMGVNQSYQGVRTAQAIINLALMTGNIGRPGTGANSITGQCNAMGSRLYSNTTNLVGHRDFTNEMDRQSVADSLGIPVEKIPNQNSLAYDQIVAAIESGRIRGLWIIATNTAHSWIGSLRAKELLSKLDFLVVQDMYHSTDTARFADLVLPAAGWGEKEGTFINSERRIGTIKRVAMAPGQALADFSILRLIADAWGCGSMFSKWTRPADVFESMKQISSGRACDITGINDYAMLDRCGGVQWPWTAADAIDTQEPAVHRRLFEDGRFYHSDGRARFIFAEPKSVPEPTTADYPFVLLTGRGSVSQWHTETRTAKSPILQQLSPAPNVEVNPIDALRLGIRDGDLVEVRSRRGRAQVRVLVTSTVQPNQLFMAMHNLQTNLLTFENVDPESRQPCYKHCAVALYRLTQQAGVENGRN
ncbi:MAG: nitrate reductase [Pirellulaceae bacterium]|nr:nitrate reductase [Pirellulaceae bacterium]